MGSFCTKCGKPLAEGEVCNCVNQTQNMNGMPNQGMNQNMNGMPNQGMNQNMNGMPNQTINQAAAKTSNYLKDVFEVAKKFFANPISEGKAFAQKGDIKQAAFFIGVQALLSSIFALVICFKLSSLFAPLTSLYSSLSSSKSSASSMPYVSAFFGTLVISLVLSFILAGVLWCAYKIVKNNVSYQQMVGCVAMRSLIQAVVTIVCIIICMINIIWGAGLFCLVGLTTFLVFGFIVPDNNQVVSQKIIYAILGAVFIFLCIMLFIMSKTSGLYLPASKSISSLYRLMY